MKKDPKTETKKPRKPSTPEQRRKRRAAHWRKTGVSENTINWMRENCFL